MKLASLSVLSLMFKRVLKYFQIHVNIDLYHWKELPFNFKTFIDTIMLQVQQMSHSASFICEISASKIRSKQLFLVFNTFSVDC